MNLAMPTPSFWTLFFYVLFIFMPSVLAIWFYILILYFSSTTCCISVRADIRWICVTLIAFVVSGLSTSYRLCIIIFMLNVCTTFMILYFYWPNLLYLGACWHQMGQSYIDWFRNFWSAHNFVICSVANSPAKSHRIGRFAVNACIFGSLPASIKYLESWTSPN